MRSRLLAACLVLTLLPGCLTRALWEDAPRSPDSTEERSEVAARVLLTPPALALDAAGFLFWAWIHADGWRGRHGYCGRW